MQIFTEGLAPLIPNLVNFINHVGFTNSYVYFYNAMYDLSLGLHICEYVGGHRFQH